MNRINVVSGDIRKAKADVIVTRAEAPRDDTALGSARFADPKGLRSKYHVHAWGPDDSSIRPHLQVLGDAYENALYLAGTVHAKFVAVPLLFPKHHPWDERNLIETTLQTLTDYPADMDIFLVSPSMVHAQTIRNVLYAPGTLRR